MVKKRNCLNFEDITNRKYCKLQYCQYNISVRFGWDDENVQCLRIGSLLHSKHFRKIPKMCFLSSYKLQFVIWPDEKLASVSAKPPYYSLPSNIWPVLAQSTPVWPDCVWSYSTVRSLPAQHMVSMCNSCFSVGLFFRGMQPWGNDSYDSQASYCGYFVFSQSLKMFGVWDPSLCLSMCLTVSTSSPNFPFMPKAGTSSQWSSSFISESTASSPQVRQK